MTDIVTATCKHKDIGLPWLRQPVPGGEVRRVKLCSCGRTTLARLRLSGTNGFDNQALRIKLFERPVLVVEAQDLMSADIFG